MENYCNGELVEGIFRKVPKEKWLKLKVLGNCDLYIIIMQMFDIIKQFWELIKIEGNYIKSNQKRLKLT